MLTILLNALVPIFGGLLLGYVAGRRGLMDNGNVGNLIVFVMNIAIPCSLVSIIIGMPWEILESQAVTALAISLVFAGLYAGCYFWARRRLGMSIADSSVLALTIGVPNAAAVTLPLLSDAFGSHAAVPAALSLAIGSVTISLVTLALLEAQRDSPREGVRLAAILRSVPRAFGRPVVWAPLAALLCIALHVRFPSYVQGTFRTLGNAATGLRWSLQGSSPRPNTSGSKGTCCLHRWRSWFCSPSWPVGDNASAPEPRPDPRRRAYQRHSQRLLRPCIWQKLSFDSGSRKFQSDRFVCLGWVTLSIWLLVAARFF